MTQIRPVSDLRNKFSEVEAQVLQNNEPVFLTKNGYGTMVLMSIEQYDAMTHDIDAVLNETDRMAASTSVRYTADEVFDRARRRIREQNV